MSLAEIRTDTFVDNLGDGNFPVTSISWSNYFMCRLSISITYVISEYSISLQHSVTFSSPCVTTLSSIRPSYYIWGCVLSICYRCVSCHSCRSISASVCRRHRCGAWRCASACACVSVRAWRVSWCPPASVCGACRSHASMTFGRLAALPRHWGLRRI